MKARTVALRRIATLYSVVEEMHSIALQQATAAVHESETAIRAVREAGVTAASAGRLALSSGEREGWLFAQAEQEISAARADLLEGVKAQRIEAQFAAREEFMKSRIKTEQMKKIVAQMAGRAVIEEGRRAQATSDDRYAARRNWLSSRSSR